LPTTPRSRGTAALAPPISHELIAAPELAILIALDQLLELVNCTLVSVHPGLASERSRLHPLDPQAALADQIVRHGARLATAMTRYRAAVLTALHRPDTDDDLPF
jgi:hypothetical protein